MYPSGRVFVADTNNHRMQVLNPDMSYSHMFGIVMVVQQGQFSYPSGVAIDNSGVVYATDEGNHRVQFFSADGQFISTFGRAQHGQLYCPVGICVDSANTVCITDHDHHVSLYTSSEQFMKCFGTQWSGEGELLYPIAKGVAVDNTCVYISKKSRKRRRTTAKNTNSLIQPYTL